MTDRVKQLEEIHKNALALFKKKNTDYGDDEYFCTKTQI